MDAYAPTTDQARLAVDLLQAHRCLELARARVNRIVELSAAALDAVDLEKLTTATNSIDLADSDLCQLSARH